MWQLENWSCDQTQKLKLWPNSKTKIVTKLKNLNCDKTQFLTKKSFCKNNLTPQQLMRCSHGSVLRSRDVFLFLARKGDEEPHATFILFVWSQGRQWRSRCDSSQWEEVGPVNLWHPSHPHYVGEQFIRILIIQPAKMAKLIG